jgi:hypothetical protein
MTVYLCRIIPLGSYREWLLLPLPLHTALSIRVYTLAALALNSPVLQARALPGGQNQTKAQTALAKRKGLHTPSLIRSSYLGPQGPSSVVTQRPARVLRAITMWHVDSRDADSAVSLRRHRSTANCGCASDVNQCSTVARHARWRIGKCTRFFANACKPHNRDFALRCV